MTPALILNVVLAVVVLVAIVGLLVHSIHADRAAHAGA
jgi:FtsZ-interacting cell division protein ZipA